MFQPVTKFLAPSPPPIQNILDPPLYVIVFKINFYKAPPYMFERVLNTPLWFATIFAML